MQANRLKDSPPLAIAHCGAVHHSRAPQSVPMGGVEPINQPQENAPQENSPMKHHAGPFELLFPVPTAVLQTELANRSHRRFVILLLDDQEPSLGLGIDL